MAQSGEWVILLICSASGKPTQHDKRYVKAYVPPAMDVNSRWVGGTLESTERIEEAMAFADSVGAFQKYTQQNGLRPYDGRPNKPLTAWTVEISLVP